MYVVSVCVCLALSMCATQELSLSPEVCSFKESIGIVSFAFLAKELLSGNLNQIHNLMRLINKTS